MGTNTTINDTTPQEIATLACYMEALAPKAGNVSPGVPFKYINDLSFIASAHIIGKALQKETTGQIIEEAVTQTKNKIDRNTNLGIILLLAPLVKATKNGQITQQMLKQELSQLTQQDSQHIYNAIQKAAPEGLGKSDKHDVNDQTQTAHIMEAMKYASDKDQIASEYTTGYDITYNTIVPTLQQYYNQGLTVKQTIIQTQLTTLSKHYDTLIARKLDKKTALKVTQAAQKIINLGGILTPQGKKATQTFKQILKDKENLLNPGTTADLMAAGIYIFLTQQLKKETISQIIAKWDKIEERENLTDAQTKTKELDNFINS